ncbi:MAG: hypothetical protein U0166_11555 [Acidobacteriota bacterium]
MGAASGRSTAETWLVRWAWISLVLYGGCTLVFLFGRGPLFATINATGRLFGLPETPPSTEMFWLALTISMMTMLCVCCVMIGRDVRRNVDFCIPIVFGKIGGALVGILAFALWRPYPAHVTIALTDVPMGLVTWVLWSRARRAIPSG